MVLPTPSAEGLRREEYGEVSSERRTENEPNQTTHDGEDFTDSIFSSLVQELEMKIKVKSSIIHLLWVGSLCSPHPVRSLRLRSRYAHIPAGGNPRGPRDEVRVLSSFVPHASGGYGYRRKEESDRTTRGTKWTEKTPIFHRNFSLSAPRGFVEPSNKIGVFEDHSYIYYFFVIIL